MKKAFEKIGVFLEMIKFEHSIFALPFAYMGLILGAKGWCGWTTFGLITLAMVSFRTMAMGLNRIIDAAIDAKNPRTKSRAIPAGKLKVRFVWLITGICFVVFEWTCWMLSPVCLYLSPIVVFLAWLYPWLKRFTWFSHFVLGIILGIAPYGAWLAVGRDFSWTPGFLTIGIAAWVAGFDIIYALQDADFDRESGLFSFPAKFGQSVSLWLTRFLHILTLTAWAAAGVSGQLSWIFFVGILLSAVCLIREHWLIHSRGLAKINEAFFTMNAIISMTVMVAVILDSFFGR